MVPAGTPLDRAKPPGVGPIRPFRLPDVDADSLPNGLQLRSMSWGQVPLASACLVLNAGETEAPLGREGVAVLTGDALQGGTEYRTGAELAELLEGLGSGLRVSTAWDAASVTFTCIAERIDKVLSLLSEVIRAPSFPPQEVERVRQQRLAAIRQRGMDPADLAYDELSRRIFEPEHPYHRPVAGDESSVASIDRTDLEAFASERYAPVRAGLVVVGDLAPDQVLELAQAHLGQWETPEAPDAEVPTPNPPSSRSLVIVHRPGAVQSELRIGHPVPARGHPDEIPLRVSNAVLGGAFTSRLNLSLREEHGFTYGARSTLAFRKNGGAFTIGAAVQTEVTAPALREALAVFDAFAETGPSPEELERARDYLAGVFPLRMETTAQLAARLAEVIIFDLPDDYHHTYRDRIRAVDVESARVVVREHFRPERAAVIVVGDADRIGVELEALELGPVEVAGPWA